MSFYESIADYYEKIFPLNKAQLDFVKNSFEETSSLSALDIGCGTGSLSFELSKIFNDVTAIDLDERMLDRAIEKNVTGIRFLQKDMLDIEKEFGREAFDAILCFGNTLVHLDGSDEIFDFFKQSKRVFKKNGKLLFQIIQYDRIIDQNIKGLPTIENNEIKFVRNYQIYPDQNALDFKTTLTVKETGKMIENSIRLYPVSNFELIKLLNEAGFTEIFFYKNFKREVISVDSIPLVVEAY